MNAKAEGLIADWRLNIANNAALRTAAAALEACGYRAAREAHHYRVIESLRLSIGAEDSFVIPLDRLRQKRNIGVYERAGQVSNKEADTTGVGLNRLAGWLRDGIRVAEVLQAA